MLTFMKSTKVQTLGAGHAIVYRTLCGEVNYITANNA